MAKSKLAYKSRAKPRARRNEKPRDEVANRGGIKLRWVDPKAPAPAAPTYQYAHELPLYAYKATARLEGSLSGGNDTNGSVWAGGGSAVASSGSAFLFMPSVHSSTMLMTVNMRDPTVLGDVLTDTNVPNETVRAATLRAPYIVGPTARQRLMEGVMRITMSGGDLITGFITVFRVSREALETDLGTYSAAIIADRDVIYRVPIKELAHRSLEIKCPVTNPATLPKFETPSGANTVRTSLPEDNALDGIIVCLTDFDHATTMAEPTFVVEVWAHVEMLINPSSTYTRTNNPRVPIAHAEKPSFGPPVTRGKYTLVQG